MAIAYASFKALAGRHSRARIYGWSTARASSRTT